MGIVFADYLQFSLLSLSLLRTVYVDYLQSDEN